MASPHIFEWGSRAQARALQPNPKIKNSTDSVHYFLKRAHFPCKKKSDPCSKVGNMGNYWGLPPPHFSRLGEPGPAWPLSWRRHCLTPIFVEIEGGRVSNFAITQSFYGGCPWYNTNVRVSANFFWCHEVFSWPFLVSTHG